MMSTVSAGSAYVFTLSVPSVVSLTELWDDSLLIVTVITSFCADYCPFSSYRQYSANFDQSMQW